MNKQTKETLKEFIKKTLNEIQMIENLPPGFSPADFESIEDFIKDESPLEEETEVIDKDSKQMIDVPGVDMSDKEMQDYLKKVASGTKPPAERYKYPYIHKSNIVDDNGKIIDTDKLKSMIMQRPYKIIKDENTKMKHSGGETYSFHSISLPAFKGIIVDEATGKFRIINTCPAAGACRVYCYARHHSYVQFPDVSLGHSKILNFLVNDYNGFKTKLLSELTSIYNKNKVSGFKTVLRWCDSGDWISPKFLEIAYDIAKSTPEIKHYAYTKQVSMVSGSDKPKNFIFTFSKGATPEEEKLIDPKLHRHSEVVPKELWKDLIHRNKELDKDEFNDNKSEDILKDRIAKKYNLDKSTIVTYDEMLNIPENPKRKNKLSVLVMHGNGDDASTRTDVLTILLFIH